MAKINIGNWNIKVSSTGQNVAPDEKTFGKLTGQKLRKVRKFFFVAKFYFFVLFDRLPERVGGGGAKSHSAGAPWWIMKVI